MNKYMAITEFEEVLNNKKAAIEEERKPIQEIVSPQRSQKRMYAFVGSFCCILLALVTGGAYLRLEGRIAGMQSLAESAVKDIGTVKARIASDNISREVAGLKAQVDELQAAKVQLESAVGQLKTTVETARNTKDIRLKATHVAGGRKNPARSVD